jgi:stage V sporulation protein R
MTVMDGDYLRAGEIYIKHWYDGMELDVKYIEKTIPFVHQLWGKTVHLETVIEERAVLFTYDGKKVHRRFL